MSLTYTQYVATIQNLGAFNASNPRFAQILPSALDYAQDRIDRELNLLNTVATNSSLALTAGTRSLNIAAATINVLQDVNVITPAGQNNPNAGTRNQLVFTTKEYFDAVYGNPTQRGLPEKFTVLDTNTILVAPWPDQAYQVELVGTVRQQSLSQTNAATWVSTYLPDLLIAASMIFVSGYMRNFGSQADDPKMAMSWEQQYSSLRDSAGVEDARRKFAATGWTSELPNAYTPPRT